MGLVAAVLAGIPSVATSDVVVTDATHGPDLVLRQVGVGFVDLS